MLTALLPGGQRGWKDQNLRHASAAHQTRLLCRTRLCRPPTPHHGPAALPRAAAASAKISAARARRAGRRAGCSSRRCPGGGRAPPTCAARRPPPGHRLRVTSAPPLLGETYSTDQFAYGRSFLVLYHDAFARGTTCMCCVLCVCTCFTHRCVYSAADISYAHVQRCLMTVREHGTQSQSNLWASRPAARRCSRAAGPSPAAPRALNPARPGPAQTRPAGASRR